MLQQCLCIYAYTGRSNMIYWINIDQIWSFIINFATKLQQNHTQAFDQRTLRNNYLADGLFNLCPFISSTFLSSEPEASGDGRGAESSDLFFCTSFPISGWNLRNEAHAIASWTMPSCHRNAANTARMQWDTEGAIASWATSGAFAFGDTLPCDWLLHAVFSFADGDVARSRFDRRFLLRSFLVAFWKLDALNSHSNTDPNNIMPKTVVDTDNWIIIETA